MEKYNICKGIAKSGNACKKYAKKGGKYCHLHQNDRKICVDKSVQTPYISIEGYGITIPSETYLFDIQKSVDSFEKVIESVENKLRKNEKMLNEIIEMLRDLKI